MANSKISEPVLLPIPTEDEKKLAIQIYNSYYIGRHSPKLPNLVETIRSFGDYSRPYQIFLGGPQSTRMNITNEELVLTKRAVEYFGANVFVHSQYIINLSNENEWSTNILIKNLEYAQKSGFKGVVVHVGKSVKLSPLIALDIMKKNISKVLEYSTEECPLLLETPAGQGTELLTESKDFIDFVGEFDSKKLGVVVDTCHTFACGKCPLEYIKYFTEGDKKEMLKLIHFNDSKEKCGSRKDRHAFIGEGHIGLHKMNMIAHYCYENKLPMVIE
jgi:deoxyribonuclease-4